MEPKCRIDDEQLDTISGGTLVGAIDGVGYSIKLSFSGESGGHYDVTFGGVAKQIGIADFDKALGENTPGDRGWKKDLLKMAAYAPNTVTKNDEAIIAKTLSQFF